MFLCFHPTTIKSYTVYSFIMFFPFLFSVENVCPLCHKSFKKNYLMKKHFELIHEGKKSYQCHQCAHLFATKAGLIHHQQHVHEGIKFHCQVCRNNALWLWLNYCIPKMWGHRWRWISHKMNIRYPGQLKKWKSWGPFWSYQLNSTANPAHLPQEWAKWTKLAVLFTIF